MATHTISINNLAELKATSGSGNVIFLLGKDTIGDGFSGKYWWNAESVADEDTKFMNVVKATGVEIGRWERITVKVQELPQGFLVSNSGKKELFVPTTIDANSEATINLTFDNTTNGDRIFEEIWFDTSIAQVEGTTANNIVVSARKSLSSDLKVLTHRFARGNTSSVSIGISVNGMRAAQAGTPVTIKVEGI